MELYGCVLIIIMENINNVKESSHEKYSIQLCFFS